MRKILIVYFIFNLFLVKQQIWSFLLSGKYGFDCCLLASKSAYVVSYCNVSVYGKWIYYFVETNEYLNKKCIKEKGSNMLYIDNEIPKVLDKNSLNLTLFEIYFRPASDWSEFSLFGRNILGFDLDLDLNHYDISRNYGIHTNQYVQSSLKLFHEEELYENECDLMVIENLIGINASKNVKITGSMVIFNDPIQYSENTCNYLFMNAFISTLTFTGIKNSIIENNQLGFIDLYNGSTIVELNCNIESVVFEVYRVNIGKKLLNRQLFEKTKQINIKGVINKIDSDLDIFDWLPNLTILVFELKNTDEFVDLNRNWLSKYVNESENRFNDFENEKNFIKIMWNKDVKSNNGLLSMKDEDFCLFSNYPVNKTIFHVMEDINEEANCTCTMAYLIQNYYFTEKTKSHLKYYFDSNICTKNLKRNKFWKLVKKCKFKKRLKLCKLESANKLAVNKVYFNINDLIYNVKKIKFIFVIIGKPVASLIGIFFNLLILITLRKRKNNQPNQSVEHKSIKIKMTFEYIELNSLINLMASVIYSFQLIIDCVDYSSIFCSDFYYSKFGKLFYIYVINFFGSSLKISSSLTTLMFSLTRCLMILQKEYLFKYIPIFKLKPKLVLIAILIVSFALCIIKIFFNDRQYFVLKPNVEFDADYIEKFQSDFDKLIKKYNYINIISFFLNDFLITMITILIDCLIVYKIKSSKNRTGIRSFNIKQLNLNKLIIYNGFFQFLFKLPDMIFNILMNYHTYDKWNSNRLWFCDIYETSRENSVCLNLLESGQYFYILSFSLDFFLLYKFNSQFRIAFLKTIKF
jgi:hypothetical protein